MDCRKYGLKAVVADLQDYDMADLPRLREIQPSLALFAVATCVSPAPGRGAVHRKEGWHVNGGRWLCLGAGEGKGSKSGTASCFVGGEQGWGEMAG